MISITYFCIYFICVSIWFKPYVGKSHVYPDRYRENAIHCDNDEFACSVAARDYQYIVDAVSVPLLIFALIGVPLVIALCEIRKLRRKLQQRNGE